MSRSQRDSRIPVFRRGIPVPICNPTARATNQLPVEAATRPTALAGLTTHWPSSERQPSPNSSSTSSSPSESSAVPRTSILEPSRFLGQVTSAHLDHEVVVSGTKPGILRFFGSIPFDSGLWCGVELHKAEGLNDGSVRGIRLFTCAPLHGVLAPISKVALLPPSKASLASQSNLVSRIPGSISPSAVSVQSATSLVPSGIKRQRTNAYEAEAAAACAGVATTCDPGVAVDEDEVSTPREELVGERSTEERWSSEEVTPPAEQLDHASSLLCQRVARVEKETPTENNEKSIVPLSPSSVPTPITPRTLDWTRVKTAVEKTATDSWGSSVTGVTPSQPRSISDSSLCEMAGVVSASTPTTALASRSSRRGHSGGVPSNNNSNSSKQPQQQQQRQQCNNDVTYSVQRSNEECYGGQHNGDACACGHPLSKHSSFEMDESLGILTPDQMVDFTVCMESYGRTPSSDDMKRFSIEDSLGFPQDPFGRTPSNDNLKRYVGEESLGDGGGLLVDAKASGSDNQKVKSVVPPELVEGDEEEMEGGEEAPVELGVHSDQDEEVEEPRMDEEEEEVKDVMGQPCSLAVANPTSETAETPASMTATIAPRPTQVAPCFVASVTSITSIDPGYQGDGEWSRPASRAENSPGSSAPPGIGVNVGLSVDVLKLKFDTMTDSDFYSDTGAGGTESDADHEEAVRDGAMAPGDRRAQVIDGTLYGGITGQQGPGGICAASHQQPPPRCFAAVMTSSTATTTEEMESSGVFSDLDRRTDLRISFHSHALPRPSSAQGVSSSAAESSDVPQSPLEELPEDPKKDVTFGITELGETNVVMDPDEEPMREEQECALVGEKMDTLTPPEEGTADDTMVTCGMSVPETTELTRIRIPSAPSSMSCEVSPNLTPTNTTPMTPPPRPSSSAGSKDRVPQQQQEQQGQTPRQKNTHGNTPVNVSPPKKHKMPKRNVASKIKAMIEASSTKDESTREEGEGSSRRGQSQRPGRWDAIMSKIAAGQAEQRTSRPRLREVKSKVMAGITSANTTMNSTTNEEGGENATPSSVRTKKTFISNVTRARRAETRRTRARGLEISSLRDATCSANAAAPNGGVGDSLNPSVHSSMSDVSLDRGAGNKASVSSRSSKKREADRSASPFSDGSSNSGASNIPRPLRNNLGAVTRQPSQKSTASEMKNPSVRKPVTRHLASSAAQVQKPAPLRESNRLPGGVLSKNGGPLGGHGNNNRGNAVVLVQRQHLQSATVEPPPSESVVESIKKGSPPKCPPPLPPKLLEELKYSATGVEALGVLIQHLVFDLEAFSTPGLKKALEEYKSEAINTKLSLDEAVASCKRYSEAAELSEVGHKEHIDKLIKNHEETLLELETRLNSQVEETQCRYEEELKRRDRLNARNVEALLEDVKLYAERAERAEKRADGAEKRAENLDKEREDLLGRENDLKQLSCQLQCEINELHEKMRKEDVTRSGGCGKHRDEIQSLQAVLDLRTKELHDHRKKTEEYKLKSEALNSALARNAALQARVEDLEAQLQRKVSVERKLQEEVRSLSETAERESRQSEQLALENEVLEWKISENSKLMASFSGQSDMSSSMTGSMMASSSPSSDRRSASTIAISLGSPESPPDFMYRRYSPRLSPKSPYSDVMGTIELEEDDDEEDDGDEDEDDEDEIKVEVEEEEDKLSIEPTLITPKVRTLVEKNESISWLVEMEEVIPATSFSSHVPSVSMRRSCHGSPSPLNLLPQMMPELPGPISPSTSPTSSDPSSNLFRGKGGPHSNRKGAMPPAKKTRPERGKSGGSSMMYTSTPSHMTSMHSHHRHIHHGRYHHHHHQPRSTSRLPPSDSTLGSARSRSVSTDSESFDAEEASSVANARIVDLKAWRGGKSFASSVDRVPHLDGTSENDMQQEGAVGEDGKGEGGTNESGEKVAWEVNGEGEMKFVSIDARLHEDCRTNGPFSRASPSTPLGERDSSKRSSSPYCEFSDDFSNQSPFHGKFEVNGTSLNPMEDSSSSVELISEVPEKQPSPPPPPTSAKLPSFHPPVKQGITMVEPSSILHQTHQLHHHHYQPRHVLSSLCAHPHLSIKESAGEAMISEEISDDTQGESEDEDQEEGKPSDSEEEDVGVVGKNGEAHCLEEGNPDGVTPSAEPGRLVVEREENGEDSKGQEPQEEPTTNNTLKLGQQLLSSSTPDSSHFAHTDSSVMDLSWSEDLDLMPSESEV